MSSDISLDILSSDDRIFDAVRVLLKTWSLHNYLARKPPCNVVTLSSTSTCCHALRTLALHSISSAPVFDGSVCLGFLDVSDIVRALLDIVSVRDLTDENKDFQLRSAGLQLENQQLHSLRLAQDGSLIYKADLQSTLLDVILYGFLQPNAAGQTQVVHRVGVFDSEDDVSDFDDVDMDTDSDHGNLGHRRLQGINVTHVISQSDVVQFLARHLDELGSLGGVSVRQLGLADKAVVCVPAEMTTVHAFATMMANKVSCVGVISHSQGGGLAASLSSSDLCGLLPEHFVALGAPVLQYLTAKASPGWAMQQHALVKPCKPQLPPIHGMKPILRQPAQDKDEQQDQEQQQQLQQPEMPQHSLGSAQAWGLKSGEGHKAPDVLSCSPDTTFSAALQLMAAHNLHRLHVLDNLQRPVGIITITDLLRVIVGATGLLEAYGPDLNLEQEAEQPTENPDCSMGVDTGHELIDRGMLTVPSSQAVIDTAC